MGVLKIERTEPEYVEIGDRQYRIAVDDPACIDRAMQALDAPGDKMVALCAYVKALVPDLPDDVGLRERLQIAAHVNTLLVGLREAVVPFDERPSPPGDSGSAG